MCLTSAGGISVGEPGGVTGVGDDGVGVGVGDGGECELPQAAASSMTKTVPRITERLYAS